MIPIQETTVVQVPMAQAWALLRDARTVTACIPGAELSADSTDDVWRGSVRVKFGPTTATFRGEATLAFDDDAKRCTINGRGIDQRGASRATTALEITALPQGDATQLNIGGHFNVTGPLSAFASTGGVHLVRVLLNEFSTNLCAQAAASRPTPQAGAVAQAPRRSETRDLQGLALMWRVLVSWFRSRFGKQ